VATVPVTRTWVAGEVVTAAYMNNNITSVLNWLLAPAVCQVRQIVAQSLSTGAYTPVTYTAEDVDSTGMHSTTVNTSRLTAVYPGWYGASSATSHTANATGRRGGRWQTNGAALNASAILIPAVAAVAIIYPGRTMQAFLNVGDYLEYASFQDSGGGLLTLVTSAEQSQASVWWLSN
jgi:hypothetical protein